jgi:uncharacterized protein
MRDLYRSIEEDFSLLDRRAIGALVYTAAALTCIYYFGNAQRLADFLHNTGFESLAGNLSSAHSNLPALAYWVAVVVLFYFVLPAIGIRFILKRELKDYGLSRKSEKGFWKIYAQCAAVMIPLVYLVSLTEGFANKYPFLKIYDGAEPYFGATLLVWEILYFLQFFGLEFFFRGFLVHSLKPALGFYSIFVMTVPYCMIHFGKPATETFAAIFAGIFLGWLSYKNGSIWLGLLLHCTIALEMDVLALHHKGLLF